MSDPIRPWQLYRRNDHGRLVALNVVYARTAAGAIEVGAAGFPNETLSVLEIEEREAIESAPGLALDATLERLAGEVARLRHDVNQLQAQHQRTIERLVVERITGEHKGETPESRVRNELERRGISGPLATIVVKELGRPAGKRPAMEQSLTAELIACLESLRRSNPPAFTADEVTASAAPLSESVACGAELLDEKMPGWAGKIDVSTLNLASALHDILFQLFGDDSPENTEHVGVRSEDAERFGFALRDPQGYPRLTALWRSAIASRLDASHPGLGSPDANIPTDSVTTGHGTFRLGGRVEYRHCDTASPMFMRQFRSGNHAIEARCEWEWDWSDGGSPKTGSIWIPIDKIRPFSGNESEPEADPLLSALASDDSPCDPADAPGASQVKPDGFSNSPRLASASCSHGPIDPAWRINYGCVPCPKCRELIPSIATVREAQEWLQDLGELRFVLDVVNGIHGVGLVGGSFESPIGQGRTQYEATLDLDAKCRAAGLYAPPVSAMPSEASAVGPVPNSVFRDDEIISPGNIA